CRRPPFSSAICATAATAVKGGATTTSTLDTDAAVSATAAASSQPLLPPRFIFQFPAISGVRSVMSHSSEGLQARELSSGEQRQGRAPAPRQTVDLAQPLGGHGVGGADA